MNYVLDSGTSDIFGFEAPDSLSDRSIRTESRGGWGVVPEWALGWKFFIRSPNNTNGVFRESESGGGIYPGLLPVEGDFFYFGDAVGDNQMFGSFGFWEYGGGLPMNDIDGWKYPGTGLIEPGDALHLRVASDANGDAGGVFEVTWFDGDDDPIGDPVEIYWNGSNQGGNQWWNVVVGDAPGLPGLPTDVIDDALIAPSGAEYFSLVVTIGTQLIGGQSWCGVDALYIQVGEAEPPTFAALWDTYPTGFRFPYKWRRT